MFKIGMHQEVYKFADLLIVLKSACLVILARKST